MLLQIVTRAQKHAQLYATKPKPSQSTFLLPLETIWGVFFLLTGFQARKKRRETDTEGAEEGQTHTQRKNMIATFPHSLPSQHLSDSFNFPLFCEFFLG